MRFRVFESADRALPGFDRVGVGRHHLVQVAHQADPGATPVHHFLTVVHFGVRALVVLLRRAVSR